MAYAPIHPDQVTERYWKNNMGKVYQMSKGKAGLSAALRKVDTEVKKVDWDAVDPTFQCKDCMFGPDFDAEKTKAVNYYNGKKAKLKQAVDAVDGPCNKVIAKVRNSKLIPKSTRVAAALIQQKALDFSRDIDRWDTEIANYFDQRRDGHLRNIGIASKKLVACVNGFLAEVRQLENAVRSADQDADKLTAYDSFRREYIRGIGTALPFFKKAADFGQLYNYWKTASSDGGQPKNASEIPGKIKTLKTEHGKLATVMKNNGLI